VITVACASPTPRPQSPLDVRVVDDEAVAVLALVDELAAGREPPDSAWRRLFASEGYRRLAQREAAMQRAFTD
jgi:hypothetical protein